MDSQISNHATPLHAALEVLGELDLSEESARIRRIMDHLRDVVEEFIDLEDDLATEEKSNAIHRELACRIIPALIELILQSPEAERGRKLHALADVLRRYSEGKLSEPNPLLRLEMEVRSA
jgi:hypothetical protein